MMGSVAQPKSGQKAAGRGAGFWGLGGVGWGVGVGGGKGGKASRGRLPPDCQVWGCPGAARGHPRARALLTPT